MRKGYLYALEGVIASLLVLLYLGNIVTVPQTTEWQSTDINTRSGDVIRTLHQTGVLEDVLVDDDPDRLDAALQAMGTGLDYNMWVSGLPRPTIEARVLATDAMTEQSPTTGTGSTRTGTSDMVGAFELRNTSYEALFKYDAAWFDYDNSGSYENDEGPCSFGDLLADCTDKPSGLQDQAIQVGYINDTLTLYNITRYDKYTDRSDLSLDHISPELVFTATELREDIEVSDAALTTSGDWETGAFDIGDVTVQLNVTSDREQVYFNESSGFHGPYLPEDEVELMGTFYAISGLDPVRLEPQNELVADVLFVDNHDQATLQRHNETLLEYVGDGNTLIERHDLSGLDRASFNQTIRRDMGVEWVDVPINTGGTTGTYFPETEPGSPAAFIEQYYEQVGVSISSGRFESTGGDEEANITLGGDQYRAVVDTGADEVGFAPVGETVTSWHSIGDTVAIGPNLVEIENLMPLELQPQPPSKFPGIRGAPIKADSTVLMDRGATWDQESASINVSSLTENDAALEDLPETVCSDPHLEGDLNTPDRTYTVVLSKVAQDPVNCDSTGYTHVSLDFNNDGAANRSADETPNGFDSEGIHLSGATVEINHRNYRLFPEENGTWLYFERVVPETVPAAVWSSNAYERQGNYLLTGASPWQDDIVSLMVAATLRGGVERYQLTDSRLIGDTSVGASYTFVLDQTVFSPYTVDTIWWYN